MSEKPFFIRLATKEPIFTLQPWTVGEYRDHSWMPTHTSVSDYIIGNYRVPSRKYPWPYLKAATTIKCAMHLWFDDPESASRVISPHPDMFGGRGYGYRITMLRKDPSLDVDKEIEKEWLFMQSELFRSMVYDLTPEQVSNIKKCLDKCQATITKHKLGRPKTKGD